MTLNRRTLLKRSALLSLAPVIPSFLLRTIGAAEAALDRRKLVVIQLDGGNDGLNTVVPFRDENYARLRPKLKLNSDKLIKLQDNLGLHPAMKSVSRLIDQRRFSIVQGVSYPNPNRSHFESMAIWHAARLDPAEQGQYGWLGRAIDRQVEGRPQPHAVFVGSGSVPEALWGRRSEVAAMRSIEDLRLATSPDILRAALAMQSTASETIKTAEHASAAAFATAAQLSTLVAAPAAGDVRYPQTQIGNDLKLLAALIKSDSPARILYASQTGYDTHAGQLDEHERLLDNLSDALAAFVDDMTASKLNEEVLVLAFSEFGRRAAENGSAGTDHGAAGPIFLAGPTLPICVHGPVPNLGDLDEGDVKMSVDFRQVYATILDRWLQVPPEEVLGGTFEALPIL